MPGLYPARHDHRVARRLIAMILLVSLAPTVHLVADDIWPLVKQSEGTVWGTIQEVQDGVDDRLLVISVDDVVDGFDPADGQLRLWAPAGQLPEGVHLPPGTTGLFLYSAAVGLSEEFGEVDGEFLAHGRLSPTANGRDALRSLVQSRDVEADSDPLSAALDLLEDECPATRAVALGWLREPGLSISAAGQSRIGAAFANENDRRNQLQFMELFLARAWPLAGDGATKLVLGRDDPEIAEMAILYLGEHATPDDRAALLEGYPQVPRRRRVILLRAYAQLGIQESAPYWWDALLSGDAREALTAIEGLAVLRPDGAEEIYEELLGSDRFAIRRLALRGLGTLATPHATQILTDYRDRQPAGHRLRPLVDAILKHPFRHGQPRPRVSAPGRSNGNR